MKDDQNKLKWKMTKNFQNGRQSNKIQMKDDQNRFKLEE